MEQLEYAINPGMVQIPFLGIEVGSSMLVAWLAMAILIVAAIVIRVFILPKFKDVPGRFQMLIEMMVDGIRNYTRNNLHKGAEWMSSYVFALALYIVVIGLSALIGIRPATADLSMTAAMAVISLCLIFGYSIKFNGFRGMLRGFSKPNPFIGIIVLITEIAKPVSLACRMFGNMLGGLIVMELIYIVCAPVIPAFASLYFDLFHMLMQAYIFITLTLAFIEEGLDR